MDKQVITMDVFDKYLDVMNRLWNLNQTIMRRNMEYTLWNKTGDKPPYDDLPF